MPQCGTHFFNLDLEDGTPLAFFGLVRTLLEPSLHDDTHTALEAFGHVLRVLPPD